MGRCVPVRDVFKSHVNRHPDAGADGDSTGDGPTNGRDSTRAEFDRLGLTCLSTAVCEGRYSIVNRAYRPVDPTPLPWVKD